jgi:hypothetical protein
LPSVTPRYFPWRKCADPPDHPSMAVSGAVAQFVIDI